MIGILFLHGGGHSSSARYTELVKAFTKEGLICHAFDHHADTLLGRLQEAESELAHLKSDNNLQDADIYIWGSSMGGHIACRLTEAHPQLRGIILQSAAAYSVAAESIPFGPNFTTELHRENSWQDSPAFPAINSYQGPVLAMYGEHDDIIPQRVKAQYKKRAKVYGEFYILKGGGHSMLRPYTQEQQRAWNQMLIHAKSFFEYLHS